MDIEFQPILQSVTQVEAAFLAVAVILGSAWFIYAAFLMVLGFKDQSKARASLAMTIQATYFMLLAVLVVMILNYPTFSFLLAIAAIPIDCQKCGKPISPLHSRNYGNGRLCDQCYKEVMNPEVQ